MQPSHARVPRRFPFLQAVRWTTEVYHALKAVIKKKYGMDACNVGDEGGFAPNIQVRPARSPLPSFPLSHVESVPAGTRLSPFPQSLLWDPHHASCGRFRL